MERGGRLLALWQRCSLAGRLPLPGGSVVVVVVGDVAYGLLPLPSPLPYPYDLILPSFTRAHCCCLLNLICSWFPDCFFLPYPD